MLARKKINKVREEWKKGEGGMKSNIQASCCECNEYEWMN
jgi:hypothetical protein